MALEYENLDGPTRQAMVGEVQRDIAAGVLMLSPRLTARRVREWPNLLLPTVTSGIDVVLASELPDRGLLRPGDEGRRFGIPLCAPISVAVAAALAESEFNRMYLRGVASRGVNETRGVEIYHGRSCEDPRPELQTIVGRVLNANTLLEALRRRPTVDGALEIPPARRRA